jgi:hypothetical protein
MTDREAEALRIIETILVNLNASDRWPDKWQYEFMLNILRSRLKRVQELLRDENDE